jgi:hypothetical protein
MSTFCTDKERIPLFEFFLKQDLEDRIKQEASQKCILRTVWVVTPNIFSRVFHQPIRQSQPKLPTSNSGFLPHYGLQQMQQFRQHQKETVFPTAGDHSSNVVQYGIGRSEATHNAHNAEVVVEVTPTSNAFLRGTS